MQYSIFIEQMKNRKTTNHPSIFVNRRSLFKGNIEYRLPISDFIIQTKLRNNQFLAERVGNRFGSLSLFRFFSIKEMKGKKTRSGLNVLLTRYFPTFETENGKIKHIFTPEGKAVPMKKRFEYQYFLKGHLGNTRVVLSQTGKTLQQNSYYPFGMLMAGLPQPEEYHDNKYLYNLPGRQAGGKKLQDDFELGWYDYGKRFYDVEVGRFHTVDPHAEERLWVSPYNYVQNNSINRIDLTGALDDWYQSEAGNVIWQEGDAKNITVNGEEFTNIGKTYSAPIEGGGYLNYFQDMPIAITNTKTNVGQLLAKNDGLFRNAMSMASTREMQSEIFITRFNINRSDVSTKVLLGTLAVPAAVIGGEFLLADGIISTDFWAGKALISAGIQAIRNKGDVDVFDVAVGAFLTPGASALIGGSIDYNPFRKNNTFNYVGGNKTLGQFGLDLITARISTTLSSKSFNSLSPYLKNNAERIIFKTITTTPSTVFSNGVNQSLKKRFNE